jgi:para-nitrobenzyl esterase
VITDSVFSCPALQADRLTMRSGVYVYEFSDPDPPDDLVGLNLSFPLGAAHSTELQYVWQRIPYLDTLPPFTPAQFTLSNQMIAYWAHLAATGDPSPGGRGGPGRAGTPAPSWPRFTAANPVIQELVPNGPAPESSAQFAAAHQCSFWATIAAAPAALSG